jgi:hypothetical protein
MHPRPMADTCNSRRLRFCISCPSLPCTLDRPSGGTKSPAHPGTDAATRHPRRSGRRDVPRAPLRHRRYDFERTPRQVRCEEAWLLVGHHTRVTLRGLEETSLKPFVLACGMRRPGTPVVPAAGRARDDAVATASHVWVRCPVVRSSGVPAPPIRVGTHPGSTAWLLVPSQTMLTVVTCGWRTPPAWRAAAGDGVPGGMHLLCGVGAKQGGEQGPQRRERDRHGRGPGRSAAEKRDVDCTGR